jgi:cell division protein FtsI (penicillin-binding protein 3)
MRSYSIIGDQETGAPTGAPISAQPAAATAAPRASRRGVAMLACVTLAFAGVAGQLVRLAARGGPELTTAMAEPIASSYARPDIVDRNGRLVATDIETHSLFADPALILDRDEAIEKLARVLPDIDAAELQRQLSDPRRRFVWIRRGLTPKAAQAVHDLGVIGLGFRKELRRAYPGSLAGHILGSVNIDNRGSSGIERYIDDHVGVEAAHGAQRSEHASVRLSIDLGVQHALEDELSDSRRRYGAAAAAGIVMDVDSGEVVAAASAPGTDPAKPAMALEPGRENRIFGGTYELGSIFKTITIAMALEAGQATPETMLDVREPLTVGRFTIRDLHPSGRPLSVAEVFLHSSNVGAGLLALQAGAEAQKAFLARLGLTGTWATEAGPVAPPQLPSHWDRAETITISYGHGIAVAPLQFAAAAAALVNGGFAVTPTFLRSRAGEDKERVRVVSADTSRRIADLMRLNVTDRAGTGRRADAPGYEVGGKTGTADLPGAGGYRSNAVISSFLGVFPASRPRYVTLVMLFEPKREAETQNQVLAGLNAAPATGRLVSRIAPLLGILPAGAATATPHSEAGFDAAEPGQ